LPLHQTMPFPKHFTYVGGKSWLVPELLKVFEALGQPTLVSPFLGSGVFEYAFARAHPEVTVHGWDANEALVNYHRAFAEAPGDLEEAIARISPGISKEDFVADQAALETVRAAEVDPHMAAVFVRFMTHCFSGKYGSWNGRTRRKLPTVARLCPSPVNFSARVGDAFEVLERELPRPGVMCYIDPPYWSFQRHYSQCRNNHFPHEELAALLRCWSEALWVLSYNDCTTVECLYEGFHATRVRRRSEKLEGGGRETSHELLIFSDGARFRLKAATAARLQTLLKRGQPPRERGAVEEDD